MQEHTLGTIDPKVLGRRLQDARKGRGLTQQDVAKDLGIARTTVTAIEQGERRVRPEELIRLSRLYGREVNELVRDREVAEEFAIQFRAAIAQAGRHQTELAQAIQEFQQLCEDYLELEQLCGAPLTRNYPPQYPIEGISPEEAADDIASAERNRLGLGDGPILRLREILESDIGLRIFYPRLPSHIAGMFAYTERLGGCIAINAMPPILDASCLLNLYASRKLREIAATSPQPFVVAEYVVQQEALYIRRSVSDQEPEEREPVAIGSLIATGLIQVITLTDPCIKI